MRLITAVGLTATILAGAASPAYSREKPVAERGAATQPLTFAIILPETHRATGRVGRMVDFASEQLVRKGYRPAGRGQAPDLKVKLRFQDSWSSRESRLDTDPSGSTWFSTRDPLWSSTTDYGVVGYEPGYTRAGRNSFSEKRISERVATHHLYVGLSVSTTADDRLLHVKEVVGQADYAKVDDAGRTLVAAAIAGVPTAGR